jgi:hypothetical protein
MAVQCWSTPDSSGSGKVRLGLRFGSSLGCTATNRSGPSATGAPALDAAPLSVTAFGARWPSRWCPGPGVRALATLGPLCCGLRRSRKAGPSRRSPRPVVLQVRCRPQARSHGVAIDSRRQARQPSADGLTARHRWLVDALAAASPRTSEDFLWRATCSSLTGWQRVATLLAPTPHSGSSRWDAARSCYASRALSSHGADLHGVNVVIDPDVFVREIANPRVLADEAHHWLKNRRGVPETHLPVWSWITRQPLRRRRRRSRPGRSKNCPIGQRRVRQGRYARPWGERGFSYRMSLSR